MNEHVEGLIGVLSETGKPVQPLPFDLDVLGQDLICFSHLRWSFVYQRPQHLMTRFAKNMRVFFWEEPIPVWEDASTGDAEPRLSVSRGDDNVTIIRPVLPEGISPEESTRLQAALLREFTASERIVSPVLWFYSPFLLGVAGRIESRLIVYDCMDELSAFRYAPPSLRRRERRLLDRAQLVFTGGHSLYESKQGQHANLHSFPSSVDKAHFLPARAGLPEPDDQAGIPHPRFGFFGVLDERLDQGLLIRLAQARPDWHFVLVGPTVKIDADLLPRRANIHYLGAKTYDALPSYVGGWDVALMPFAMNESTRLISPTKTPEYLAAGRPVVSTPIADVVRTYGHLEAVFIAATPTEFVEACERALALAGDKAWRAEVDEMLASDSWDRTWRAMSALMRTALIDARKVVHAEGKRFAAKAPGDEAVAAATPPSLFRSFFMGGFEGSSHRLPDGRQLDLIAQTGHDRFAEQDYAMLASFGLTTARDAVRWHLIEKTPGHYDWSSFLPMLRASHSAGMQIIWDLCHYGVPEHIDIWSPAFVDHYARFCASVARLVREETDETAFYCPMNEISFWAWAGGNEGRMYPNKRRRANELKVQLARATIAAIDAVRSNDPKARFIHAEPLINVVSHRASNPEQSASGAYHLSQYEAYDMIAGRVAPELGGSPAHLDIIGSNYYYNNQWMQSGEKIAFGDRLYRPLSDLLIEVHTRYRRPLLLSETGAEGRSGPAWLRYVAGEVQLARSRGVPVEGLCLYPVMDYPGWVNRRHCRCGLIELDSSYRTRRVDEPLLSALRAEQTTFAAEHSADAAIACGVQD